MKKLLAAILAAALLTATLGGCAPKEKTPEVQLPPEAANLLQFQPPKAGDKIAVIKTNMGTIKIRLFPEQAPKTVENFIGLAEEGYYDGIIFHRVMDGFMIQGGDPTGTGTGGHSFFSAGEGDRGEFEDEFSMELFNFRGALSMANAGPGTNGSQFFIVQADNLGGRGLEGYPHDADVVYNAVGGTPWLDWMHTVFGMVIEGMDVVDEIAAVKTGAADKPEKDVVMESVTIEEYK